MRKKIVKNINFLIDKREKNNNKRIKNIYIQHKIEFLWLIIWKPKRKLWNTKRKKKRENYL